MRKTKDWDWGLSPDANGKYDFPAAQLAVLMDIRDELKIVSQRLSVLGCSNFLAIPRTLKRISRNTAKPRKAKAVGKPKLRVVR